MNAATVTSIVAAFGRVPARGWLRGPWLALRRIGGAVDEAALIRASGLFDAGWYLSRHPEASRAADPVAHYVATGASREYAPHPLFLPAWYRRRNPDQVLSGLTPLGHFLFAGEERGASPHPLFDPDWYRLQDPSLCDIRRGLFRHFLEEGEARGLSPHPAFDPAHYRAQMTGDPDCRAAPLRHFVSESGAHPLSPHPLFDAAWYLARHRDVAASGDNPLVHYLTYGAAEGRRPHADLDLDRYRRARADCPREPVAAYLHLLAHRHEPEGQLAVSGSVESRLVRSGLFDAQTYLALNDDVRAAGVDPLHHLLEYGLREGRRVTTPEIVARLIPAAVAVPDRPAPTQTERREIAGQLAGRALRVGVYCNTQGNFYMREIAELLAAGLAAEGVDAPLRDEKSDPDEALNLRVFVAPHEFFFLGDGARWTPLAAARNSVLYNVEQAQTPWFSRALNLLLAAPLVIDINAQTAAILRKAGCNAVHFMPGYLAQSAFTRPCRDMSGVELVSGYEFAGRPYDWQARDELADRPIDILFVGSNSDRRDRALSRMLHLADDFRFVCVYTRQEAPLVGGRYRATSSAINCALGQRAKIVLNVHRDWLGYFEWSRLVMQGLWQGACVLTDPCLPNPLFRAGEHFLEERTPQLGEMARWLLATPEGRGRLDEVRRGGYRRAREAGTMSLAIAPVLRAFRDLLASRGGAPR